MKHLDPALAESGSAIFPAPLMRIADVERRVGISHQSIYRWMNAGQFPRPVRVGPRRVRWRVEEIETWLRSQPATQQPDEPWITRRSRRVEKPAGVVPLNIHLPDRVHAAFRREAKERGVATVALVLQALCTITDDSLFGAVLND